MKHFTAQCNTNTSYSLCDYLLPQKFASPSKVIDIHNQDTSKRIQKLQDELELRNAQISDLQQKIVDADQGKDF